MCHYSTNQPPIFMSVKTFSQFIALSKFYELRNLLGSYYILSFKETVKIFLQQLNIKIIINTTQSRPKTVENFVHYKAVICSQ